MSRRNKRYDEAFRRVVRERIRILVDSYRNECSIIDVANALGVSRQSVHFWYAGKHVPNLYNVTKLAAFYEVSVDTIVGRVPMSKVKELIG